MMSYEDIVEAQKKRDEKKAKADEGTKRGRKRKEPASTKPTSNRPRKDEMEAAKQEIGAMGLEDYCSVLRL